VLQTAYGILREQVSHRCPSGTPIPREEQLRLQFWPKTPKPCISFAVHWMTKCPLFGPKWQFQKPHEDKHYAAAIFIYLCGYAIKLKTTVQWYAQTSREDQRTGISSGGCRKREESSCSCGYRAQLGRKLCGMLHGRGCFKSGIFVANMHLTPVPWLLGVIWTLDFVESWSPTLEVVDVCIVYLCYMCGCGMMCCILCLLVLHSVYDYFRASCSVPAGGCYQNVLKFS